MKDFWKKTKETFAVGVAKADEFINDKKIETDAEYVKRENELEEMDKYITRLQKHLDEMNGNIKRAGNLISEIGTDFKDSIGTTSPDYADFSSKAQEAGTNIHLYTEKAFVFHFPTHVLSPLNKALDELKHLKKLNDDTKKAHVLYNKADEELHRAANNKSQNVAKHEKEVADKKDAYEKLHAQFIESVDDLMTRKGQICNDAYCAAINYIDELMQISHEQFQQSVPQCCFGANDKYPSIQAQDNGQAAAPAAQPANA